MSYSPSRVGEIFEYRRHGLVCWLPGKVTAVGDRSLKFITERGITITHSIGSSVQYRPFVVRGPSSVVFPPKLEPGDLVYMGVDWAKPGTERTSFVVYDEAGQVPEDIFNSVLGKIKEQSNMKFEEDLRIKRVRNGWIVEPTNQDDRSLYGQFVFETADSMLRFLRDTLIPISTVAEKATPPLPTPAEVEDLRNIDNEWKLVHTGGKFRYINDKFMLASRYWGSYAELREYMVALELTPNVINHMRHQYEDLLIHGKINNPEGMTQ